MDLGASGSCQALLNHLKKTRKLDGSVAKRPIQIEIDVAQTQNSKREGRLGFHEASLIKIWFKKKKNQKHYQNFELSTPCQTMRLLFRAKRGENSLLFAQSAEKNLCALLFLVQEAATHTPYWTSAGA